MRPWKLNRRIGWLAALLLCAHALTASAQRVQIPLTQPVVPQTQSPAFAPPVIPSPPPVFDSYAMPGEFAPAPDYGTYQFVPPPAPQPVAPAAPNWAASSASPYPPAANSYSQTVPGSGIGWESGTYGVEGWDGSVTRVKRVLQELAWEQTYIWGDSSDESFEVNRTELSSTFAFPIFGNIDHPLLITPGFAFNWFGGPDADPAVAGAPNMPPRVYDAYLDAAWFPQLLPRLGAELGIRTGVWTDFENLDDDAIRILARGMGVVTVRPDFDLLLGVVYFDRVDLKMLPAGGFHYRPNDLWDLYVVFPNPTLRRRIPSWGYADWSWYVAGEYGGGSWSLEREGKGDDRVDYNDIRIVLGVEWITQAQTRGHLEVGYVWDRELVFGDTKDPPLVDLEDSFMFRGGIDF